MEKEPAMVLGLNPTKGGGSMIVDCLSRKQPRLHRKRQLYWLDPDTPASLLAKQIQRLINYVRMGVKAEEALPGFSIGHGRILVYSFPKHGDPRPCLFSNPRNRFQVESEIPQTSKKTTSQPLQPKHKERREYRKHGDLKAQKLGNKEASKESKKQHTKMQPTPN